MSKTPATLGIELRFWPNSRSEDWAATLAALWSWDRDLRPQGFQVTSGEGWQIPDDRPWNESHATELVRLCSSRASFSWMMGNDSHRYLQCSGREGRISISIQLPVPNIAIADRYLDLLERLPTSNRPELGLLFDFTGEVAFDQEGLRRLRHVPPILHLGPRAVETLGGHDKLRRAPCEVRDAAGGGLLLIAWPDPLKRPTTDDEARMAGVATFLGISEETPLSLQPT
jgi:hypothetical protein